MLRPSVGAISSTPPNILLHVLQYKIAHNFFFYTIFSSKLHFKTHYLQVLLNKHIFKVYIFRDFLRLLEKLYVFFIFYSIFIIVQNFYYG